MKSMCCSACGLVAILYLPPFLDTASALVQDQSETPTQAEPTLADARAAIRAAYVRWGRARVELDKETLDSILAPDFYVSLYGRKISREEFLSAISRERSDRRLTRFDVEVLTVRKTEQGWTTVIAEKIEVTMVGPDGETQKQCSLWVTRDGFRKDGANWLVTFSEAIGHEDWEPGKTPPIRDW
jgi:hypothetical protein